MEQRKLIRLGNSSFAIALPKGWVDKAGLKKGDNIFITPNSNGELIIQPSARNINGERRAEIEIGEKDDQTLKRELISNYINGCNLLCIKGKRNREVNELIRKTVENLIGMEIIQNENEEMVAKDLFNMEEIDLNNFIRRMDNNLREMFDIIINGLTKRKISQVQFTDINEADVDINKFHRLISRILSIGVDNPSVLTQLKIESLSLINSWWFSFNLERIGDEVKSAARIIKSSSLEEKDHEMFIKLLAKLKSIYDYSLEFFYNPEFSKARALELISEGEKIWKEFSKLALDDKAAVARLSMKLKEVETSIYQNIKMVLNSRS